MRRNYAADFKSEIIRRRMSGEATDEEIVAETGMPLATLVNWTRHAPGRRSTKERTKRQFGAHGNTGSVAEKLQRREAAEAEARSSFEASIADPLIAVGLGLWIGEGFKIGTGGKPDNRIAMGSVDPSSLLIFLNFCEAMGLPRGCFGARVVLPRHPLSSSPDDAVQWWQSQLQFSDDQMCGYTIETRPKKNPPRYPNGTCTVYASDAQLRVKVETWSEMVAAHYGSVTSTSSCRID